MILMDVRVDDVPDGLVGNGTDGLGNLVAHRRQAGIDQQDAIIADLQRDVSTRAGNHVDLALDVDGVYLGRRCRRCAARPIQAFLRAAPRREHREAQSPEKREADRNAYAFAAHYRSKCFPLGRGSSFMFFIFAMYSGYMVSAPPRAASGG